MGAEFQTYKVKGFESEVKRLANKLREQARYDHGHSGYSGTIAEDNGETKIHDTVMSESDAENFIMDNTNKWDYSLAVPINEDKTQWLIGGIYSC